MKERISITTYAAIAFAYAALGLSGYFILTTPTYGTAVFPASGFALAAVIYWGRRVIPSIWLGSILLQLGLGYVTHTMQFDKIFLYMFIGCGAALQAWISLWLVSRVLKENRYYKLENSIDSIQFLVLTGCVGTLISASFGTISLSIYGLVDRSEFLYNWISWYAGDSFGVLACYPIFISLFNKDDGLWMHRKLRIVIPSLSLLLILVGSATIFNHWSIKQQQNQLSNDGTQVLQAIRDNLNSHASTLSALAHFAEISPDLTYHHFADFSERLLANHPDIFALSINDLVHDRDRSIFEKRISKLSPMGPYQITERNAEKQLIRAHQRNTYVPVRYITPLASNQPAVGFDIMSDSKRRQAILQSLSSGEMTTTAPIKLVQDTQAHVGALQLMPIRDASNAMTGFAVAVLKIDSLLQNALKEKIPNGLKVEIFDLNTISNEQLLYQSSVSEHPIINHIAVIHPWNGEVQAGGRTWSVKVTPIKASYLDAYSTQLQMFIIVIGIVVFILVQAFLLDITGWGFIANQKLKDSLDSLRNMVDQALDMDPKPDSYSDLPTLSNFIIQLIKENKSHIQELERVSQAKTIFLTTMSHEIRTPLNALLGMSQILKRTHLSAEQHDMVHDIDQSGQLLLNLLNDILDFSKIEAGRFEIEFIPFDIYQTLSETESSLGCLAKEKGLELHIEEPTNIRHLVIGDHFRLSQILNNLIGNSIKFTEQGSITVKTTGLSIEHNQQIIRFSITDTGIGIDPERQAQLFYPFTQGDSTITRRYGGTGLGLSICKKLVQIMDGHIGMESQLGHGSTFWFEIPYQLGERHPIHNFSLKSSQTENSPAEKNLKDYHVLVVDDNEMNRIMLTRLLNQEGATVVTCENGQLAVNLLQKTPTSFDLVMMDVQMPIMDGLTATQMIRHTLGLHELPILVCSAGVYTEEQSRAMLAGANEFVPKPIQREVMLKKIKVVAPAPHTVKPQATVEASLPSSEQQGTTPINWLEVPGIDSTTIRTELGDDPEFFLNMLQMFAQNLQTVINELPQQLQPEQTGAQMLHKLRGAAGSIGAYGLLDSSQTLETAIKNNDAQRTVLAEHFLEQIKSLLQSIVTAIESQTGQTPTHQ